MFLAKRRINFFTKIFAFSSIVVFFTLFISYIANIIFLDEFYIYRKKKMMLDVISIAKNYSIKNQETALNEYIYQIKELEGIEINIEKKTSMMMGTRTSNMMMNHIFMSSKTPLNEFSIKNIPGVGALILYYGEKLPDGRNLYVSTSLSVMNAHKHETNLFNLITGIFALIFALITGWSFSKKITKDIASLSEKAQKISQLDFSQKISIDRNDEIGDLSVSLEKMSKDLSNSINNLKYFVSTASHELRTPISVMITHATALLENKFEDTNEEKRYKTILLKEAFEMKELVENLLIISKLDAINYAKKNENINVLKVIKNSIEKYDFIELEKDLQININISQETIFADSKLLKLTFDNIIQNSFKYSPENGKVDVFQEKDHLIIINQIQGENEIDLEEIMQPFARGKNAEEMGIDGMGLGLSIIKKALFLNEIPFEIKVDKKFFIIKLKLGASDFTDL